MCLFCFRRDININTLKKEFKKYVFENYDMNDVGISRKYYHSLRVMEIANLIAINENLNETDKVLANIVGLLHDYARFPQWKKYKTYNDIISVDHGDLAVKLLFNNKEIENFNINKKYYDEMYNGIKYHNKMSIPNKLSKHSTLICKLVRDADKLDIFYLFGKDEKLFLEDDNFINKKIKEDFYKCKQIDKRYIKSRNDKIILDLGMIFDLNFTYSFKYLKENKLIDKLYERIINKEMFKEYFDYVNKYIEERIG